MLTEYLHCQELNSQTLVILNSSVATAKTGRKLSTAFLFHFFSFLFFLNSHCFYEGALVTSIGNELQQFCRAEEVGTTCCNLFLLSFQEGHLEVRNYYKTASLKAFIQLYSRKVLFPRQLLGVVFSLQLQNPHSE